MSIHKIAGVRLLFPSVCQLTFPLTPAHLLRARLRRYPTSSTSPKPPAGGFFRHRVTDLARHGSNPEILHDWTKAMKRAILSLGAAGIGASVMYLLDPDRGRRRRILLRDQLTHGLRASSREFGKAARDLGNRVQGAAASAGKALQPEHPSDEVLAGRVRSRIGRVCSHPGAIQVEARGGRVTLRGPLLSGEFEDLLTAVLNTRGVREVDNRLDLHNRPDVPPLQSAGRARNHSDHISWKPANRLLGGIAAGGLLTYGSLRGGLVGAAAKLAGLAGLARAASNSTLGSLVGTDGHCEVQVQKTMVLHAPVETVFRFWSNFSNFPRFMSHLVEVRDLGNNRSHWVVTGPGGMPVAWNARMTSLVKNELLEWESEPGSAIRHRGTVRIEPEGGDRTRISLRMCYKPPAGYLGHTVASLLGVDPKHQIDDDLVRMKSLIERGKTTAHHQSVTREEIERGEPVVVGS